jgi:hypothetical protein
MRKSQLRDSAELSYPLTYKEWCHMFESMNFEELNETDVREEILAPLLRALGYRSGTQHNVIREQLLRYLPSISGRKEAKKDPLLRGKADYILVAGGKVRWVMQAKAPDADFGQDEVDRAWTYANQPEVRAVYFALCNGRRIDVYRTKLGPAVVPILGLDYQALCSSDGYQRIERLLSPAAILRDHPEPAEDGGQPLGSGLGSLARITNGLIQYESNSANHPVLNDIKIGIADGALQRDEQGRLVAYLRTVGPSRSVQELNERLGFATFEMTSEDCALSTAPERPSIFIYDNAITLPAGEEVLDLSTLRRIKLPINIHAHVVAKASGVLSDREFAGEFNTELDFEQQMKVRMTGSFAVHLA